MPSLTSNLGPNGYIVDPIVGNPMNVTAALWANRAQYQQAGAMVRFTDVGGGTLGTGGGTVWFYNGTRWKLHNNAGVLDAIDTANAGVANTSIQQLNPNHPAIPAGVIQNYDRLRARGTLKKSGTSDSATVRLHLGPLGTTADPVIDTFTALAGVNQTYPFMADYKRLSATSVQPLGAGDRNSSLVAASTAAEPAAVTVSNLDSTPMFLSISQQMTGGTEFVTVTDFTLELSTTDS